MPKLISMKLTPKEQKDQTDSCCDVAPREFPWGLQLSLDADTLEKLNTGVLKVGEEVLVFAVATVKSIRSFEDDSNDEIDTSMELQITDLGIAEKTSRAERMYPSHTTKE